MNNTLVHNQPSGKPWQDKTLGNYARDEIGYALELVPLNSFIPNDLFIWLCKNRAEKQLFETLGNLAPLFPVATYHGQIGRWIAPPPSGEGNAVVIIIGKHNKKLRMIGGNFFNELPENYKTNVCGNFWDVIDTKKGDLDRTRFMSLYIQQHMTDDDCKFAERVTDYANNANTMPVYLMVIDGDKHYFWGMPAIVSGRRPSNLNYEKIWEGTW